MIENNIENCFKILTQGVYIGWLLTFVCKMFNYILSYVIRLFKKA